MPIPVFEIEQGTVVLELAVAAENGRPAPSPLRFELKNVNATLVNQPLPVLNVQLHGEAVAIGPVYAEGTWHRIK